MGGDRDQGFALRAFDFAVGVIRFIFQEAATMRAGDADFGHNDGVLQSAGRQGPDGFPIVLRGNNF